MIDAHASPPASRARVSRIPSPAERAAENAAFEKQAERDRFRDLVRVCAECIAWCSVGLCLLGWSVHARDVGWGRIAFYGGLVVGNSGILVSLYCANQRAIVRGDMG